VRAAQQSQDTARQLRWSRDYLAAGGSNASLRVAYLQTLFNTGRYDEVISQLKPWPLQGMDERSLQVLAASQLQRKDEPGYQASLTQLLVVAPSKDRWADLLARVASTPGFDPRQEIFVMRLQQDTATLEDADDYLRYIDLALKAGLPAEAQAVLQQGLAEGLLGKGADAAHHAKVQALVARRLVEDEKEWPALQQAAMAAADANLWAQLAQVQASKGQWAASATNFAKALATGAGLRRPYEAQLFQGICLLKAGEKAQALQTLDRVSGDETAMQLARLWKIRTAAVR
jgi:tetratricopeptide (TPR) repeat protein